jgi:hypothetical protein
MSNGAHGDLFPVRYLRVDTPVNYVETNEPLQDLAANILILDGKLARVMAEGIATTAGGGGGGTVATTGPRTLVADKLFSAGLTDPLNGTLGTDLSTVDFQSGVDESQKFEFTVPSDYTTGDLAIFTQYAVDGTSGGTVDFDVEGEIAQVAGAINAFGPTVVPLTVVTTAATPDELAFFTIAAGGFAASDRIRVQFERQGTTDSNTDTFQLLGFTVVYTGSIAPSGSYTRTIDLTENTDEPSPAPGTLGTDIDTLDHPTGSDAEQKITVTVPLEWDGISDPYLRITYAMSTAVGGSIVRVGTEGEVADVGTGAIVAIPLQTTDIAVPSTTDVSISTSIPIPAALISEGSVFVFKVARRTTAVPGNHTGSWKVLSYEMVFNTPGVVSGGSGNSEGYLDQFVFGNDVGSILADALYPIFSGDFETLYSMASSSAAARVDIAFQGKVPDGFTTIEQIGLNLYGTGAGPEYVLKVFVDGQGASAVYDPTAGAPIAAPGTISAITVSSGSLASQPLGEARFFVVVEAHIDAGEAILTSRPYVIYS